MKSLIFSALLLLISIHSFAGEFTAEIDSLSLKDSLSYFGSSENPNVYKESAHESSMIAELIILGNIGQLLFQLR